MNYNGRDREDDEEIEMVAQQRQGRWPVRVYQSVANGEMVRFGLVWSSGCARTQKNGHTFNICYCCLYAPLIVVHFVPEITLYLARWTHSRFRVGCPAAEDPRRHYHHIRWMAVAVTSWHCQIYSAQSSHVIAGGVYARWPFSQHPRIINIVIIYSWSTSVLCHHVSPCHTGKVTDDKRPRWVILYSHR